MSIKSRQHEELLRCVARNLFYFGWIETNKTGYMDYRQVQELGERSIEKYQTDPLFHAKVKALVQDIEFVLMDPLGVHRRRKEETLRDVLLMDIQPRSGSK